MIFTEFNFWDQDLVSKTLMIPHSFIHSFIIDDELQTCIHHITLVFMCRGCQERVQGHAANSSS